MSRRDKCVLFDIGGTTTSYQQHHQMNIRDPPNDGPNQADDMLGYDHNPECTTININLQDKFAFNSSNAGDGFGDQYHAC